MLISWIPQPVTETLFYGPLLPAVLPTAVCTCTAFQPLSRKLTCNHECSAENVTVYWNLYHRGNDYNITFWFDGSESQYRSYTTSTVTTVVSQMRAAEDGQLVIDKVNFHTHESAYKCWALMSDGTQCGVTDSFNLRVISLCEYHIMIQWSLWFPAIQLSLSGVWFVCWSIDTSWGLLLLFD